jgi:DNA-binding MarR family transcriptional regulator
VVVEVTPERPDEPGHDDAALRRGWDWFMEIWEIQRRQLVALGHELDLSPPQLWALRHLQPGGERPMGELARYLVCDNSNLTGITDRLERRGLVERRPAKQDRRVKMLVLTKEGERTRKIILKRIRCPVAGLEVLDEDERDQLLALLEKAGRSVLAFDPLEPTGGITR